MKITVDNTIQSLERKFKKEYPEIAKNYPDAFKEILTLSQNIEIEWVLKDGEYKLPERLGRIAIAKNKKLTVYKPKIVNYYQTRKLKKKVLEFNDHTDGYIYRIKWIRYSKVFKDFNMWKLKPGRKLSRSLAVVLKNKINDYRIEI